MNRSGLALLALAVLAILPGSARADERTRAFQAPVDRVWTVTRSTLKSLGWDIVQPRAPTKQMGLFQRPASVARPA